MNDNNENTMSKLIDRSYFMLYFTHDEDSPHRGILRNLATDHCLYYEDLGDLLIQLEHLCDYIEFPQRSTTYRTELEAPTPFQWDNNAYKAKTAFILQIMFRQNASIQGQLNAGQDKTCFRSGMELIRTLWQKVKTQTETRNNRAVLVLQTYELEEIRK